MDSHGEDSDGDDIEDLKEFNENNQIKKNELIHHIGNINSYDFN